MSIRQDRRSLETKQKAQVDSARQAAALRQKEARKRADATKADAAATRTRSTSQAQSKHREAARAREAANKYGKDAAALETKAAGYGAAIATLQAKIAKAEAVESHRATRQQLLDRRAATAQHRQLADRITSTQERVAMSERALRALGTPKPEKLRILMLGASPQGDLRITREHTRIRRAVEVAVHRDQVEFDVRLSATTQDLQEGIAKFRPHVVHFSGHGDERLIGFEADLDEHHVGVVVTASAFASACAATDTPPTLIVFNACKSSGTADALVARFAPLAIGMTDSIEDTDALTYATALYSTIANGHSVNAAHLAGKAAIELAGGEHDLPYLATAPDVDATTVILVTPVPPVAEEVDLRAEFRPSADGRTDRLHIVNDGTATAPGVTVEVQAIGSGEAPSLWDTEVPLDIRPKAEQSYHVNAHGGTAHRWRVRMSWTDATGTRQTQTQDITAI